MIKQYDRLVSLGNFCLTKYQINRHICRRFFSLEPNSTNLAANYIKSVPKDILEKINGGNGLFDWTVIVNYENLCALISSGLEYTLEEENLEEKFEKNGSRAGIEDFKAGVLWVHLFDSTPDSAPWQAQIPELNRKVSSLIRNSISTKYYSTAYIVTLSAQMAASQMPSKIYEALNLLRGPSAPMFSLVVCIPGAQVLPKDDANIFFRSFSDEPDIPQYGWLGNAASWDRIFDEFTFSEKNIEFPKI